MDAREVTEFWKKKHAAGSNEGELEAVVRGCRNIAGSWRHPVVAHVRRSYPDLSEIRVCEVGADWGRTSMALGLLGAEVTVADISGEALKKAALLAEVLGIEVECRVEDLFRLSPEMRGRFDVALSSGLIEHFDGPQRGEAVANHVRLVKPGGHIGISVPNAACPFYRLWKYIAERRGWWSAGFEKAYTRGELRSLCEGLPLCRPRIEGADFSYAFNQFFLHKIYWGLRNLLVRGGVSGGGDPFRVPSWLNVPEVGWPLSEYWGYSLHLIADRALASDDR